MRSLQATGTAVTSGTLSLIIGKTKFYHIEFRVPPKIKRNLNSLFCLLKYFKLKKRVSKMK